MDETHSHHRTPMARELGFDAAPLGLLVLPEGRRVTLAQPTAVVGRHSAAEVRLAYADVSRRHCRLAFADGAWHVCDLESLNGIFVNDVRIQSATLTEGDRIRIGEATLVVTDAPVPDAEAGVLRSIGAALAGCGAG